MRRRERWGLVALVLAVALACVPPPLEAQSTRDTVHRTAVKPLHKALADSLRYTTRCKTRACRDWTLSLIARLGAHEDSLVQAPPAPPPPLPPTYRVTVLPVTAAICAKPCGPHWVPLIASVTDSSGQVVGGPVTWHVSSSDTTAAHYWINDAIPESRRLEVYDPLRSDTVTVRARFTAQGVTAEGSAVVVLTGPGATPPPPPPDTTTPPPPPPPPSDTTRFDGRAELPRATVVRPSLPAGRTLRVAAGGNLQAAIDSARRGDVILLPAGATFTGNYKLPPKAGTSADGWIALVSEGALPAPGTRLTPTMAAPLAKLRSATMDPVIETRRRASGWYFLGLDIGTHASVTESHGLVVLSVPDDGQPNALEDIPSDIVIDRSYIHGHPALHVKRCVSLQSARSAILDSWLGECHHSVYDSQAIAAWGGPGPYAIENNHLEGAGETILFGGATPAAAGVSPSDATIRRNRFYRPMTWKTTPRTWLVKNIVEVKHGKRLLFEQNTFENHWPDGQDVHAIVLVSINQGGTAPQSTAQDIVFRYNRFDNVAGLFNLSPSYGPGATPGARMTIRGNVFTRIGTDAAARFFLVQGGLKGVTITDNTGLGQGFTSPNGSTAWLQLSDGAQYPDLVFSRNIGGHVMYAMISPLANDFALPPAHGIPWSQFTKNCVVMAYPPSPTVQQQIGNVGLASVAAAMLDAQLRPLAGSPCAGAGADLSRVPALPASP